MSWTSQFTEAFTNSDGTALETHDSTWVKRNTNGIQINAANQGETLGTSNFSLYTLSTTLSDDQAAELKLYDNSDFSGVGVRATWDGTAGNDDVDAYFVFHKSGIAYIYRRDSTGSGGPGFTLIDSQTISFSSGEVLRIEVSGTGLATYKNGSATGMPTGTDASFSSGSAVLRCFKNIDPYCDDFQADNEDAASAADLTRFLSLLGVG